MSASPPALSRIIPAYAGSTSRRRPWPVRAEGSSPHTRGAPGRSSPKRPRWRIIPAYAGSTSPAPAGQGPAPDHPRIRGEHQLSGLYTGDGQGSSPHTRGARDRLVDVGFEFGIIPAYAGSTRSALGAYRKPSDHPRIRGEHGPPTPVNSASSGSSPHTRGARQPRRVCGDDIGIIPAYAGST